MKSLSVAGAVLKPVPGVADRFGVYPHGDLRRRPIARTGIANVRKGLAEGWLAKTDSGYVMTHALDDIRSRQAGDYKRPHSLIKSRTVADDDGGLRRVRADISTSPLARWMRPDRKTGAAWLSDEEFEAGERLRADYHRSVLSERVTSDWDSYLAPAAGGSGHGRDAAPVSALAAQAHVRAALAAVGPGLDRVLSSVCLREEGLEIVEAAESWPRRSGKIVLKLALQQLGRHYGMSMPG